tara:strand:- start:514 stop:720 length:207 start_codon:yes stop_codon:yes gene_type:complete
VLKDPIKLVLTKNIKMNKDQIFGLIRHALTIAGGALVTKGVIDEAMATELIGISMSLVGVIWSFTSKK